MIEIRRARESDSREIWAWRNDPATRAASLSSDLIAWESHVDWYSMVLSSAHRIIYVGEFPGRNSARIGMCRFDLDPEFNTAEVSINVNPERRQQRLSKDLLASAIAKFRDEFGMTKRLVAVIQPSNSASKKLFSSLGFELESVDETAEFHVLDLTDVQRESHSPHHANR